MNTLPFRLARAAMFAASLTAILPAPASAADSSAATELAAPPVDLVLRHASRIMTAEGVLRESRYEERMMRRPGHVWTTRVLPAFAQQRQAPHGSDGLRPAAHEHRHFNHVLLARHVWRDGGRLRLEFVDDAQREVVAISPAEYENVAFDGSWANAYFIADPKAVASLPLSARTSPVEGARWHEREQDGAFLRILWDERRMIPLVVESGRKDGSIWQRIDVTPAPALASALPWTKTGGYARREFADFLD